MNPPNSRENRCLGVLSEARALRGNSRSSKASAETILRGTSSVSAATFNELKGRQEVNPRLTIFAAVVFIFMFAVPLTFAANDPGHDSLYVLLNGNSNISGSINVTGTVNASFVRVATLFYGDQLDIRANNTIQSVSSRPAIQSSSTQLYIDANGNLNLNTQGGTANTVQVGPTTGSSITLNVSGVIKQQNVNVCLQNGTFCPGSLGGANVSGSGTIGTHAIWTSSTGLGNSGIVSESGNLLTINGNVSVPTNFWIGSGASATAYGALAIGWGAKANDSDTIAIGRSAFATGSGGSTVAVGTGAVASGGASDAIGYSSTASGAYSNAYGVWANANNSYANAFGYSAQANGVGSNAYGYNVVASGQYATAYGHQAYANDTDTTALGRGAGAKAVSSTAVGDTATASGPASNTMGAQSIASGGYSNAYGVWANANNSAANAFGYGTQANGASSSAFGDNAKANTDYSGAFGAGAKSNGSNTNAFGASSLASGTFANAVGNIAVATGDYANAFGYGAIANVTGANAFGHSTVAAYTYSFALGYGATTTAANQLMVGSSGQNLNTYVWGTLNTTGNLYENNNRVCTASNGLCAGSGILVNGSDANFAKLNVSTLNIGTTNLTCSQVNGCVVGATTGSGNAGNLSYWTTSTNLGSSVIYQSGSNVGIGTASPSQKLHVNGSVNISTGNLYVSGGINASGNSYIAGSKICTASNGVCPNSGGTVTDGFGAGAAGVIAVWSGLGSDITSSLMLSETTDTLYVAGNINMTGGNITLPDSFSIGNGAASTSDNTTAVGSVATASAQYASAYGYNATAGQTDTIAIGHTAYATGLNTIAIGTQAAGTGSYGVAIGYYSAASNTYATAVGTSAMSTNPGSVSYGYGAQSTNDYAITIGYQARAGGMNSTAIGPNAHADTSNSFAIGQDATATANNQFVIGNATARDILNTTLFGSLNTTGAIYAPQICLAGTCKTSWPAAGSSIYTGSGAAGNITMFVTNGTNFGSSVLYQSGSNVGIGTATPGANLDVNGTFSVGINTSASPGSGAFYTTASGAYYPGGNAVMKGGDNPGGSYPSQVGAKITAYGGDYGAYGGGHGGIIVMNLGNDPTGIIPSLFIQDYQNNNLMVINATGKVGIGVSNPSEKLSVSGNVSTGNVYVTGGANISANSYIAGSQICTAGNGACASGSNPLTGSGAAGNITMWVTNSTNFGSSVIYQSGSNIGIGSAGPTAALEINSTSSLGALNVYNSTNSILFVNGSSGYIGIGNSTPAAPVDIVITRNNPDNAPNNFKYIRNTITDNGNYTSGSRTLLKTGIITTFTVNSNATASSDRTTATGEAITTTFNGNVSGTTSRGIAVGLSSTSVNNGLSDNDGVSQTISTTGISATASFGGGLGDGFDLAPVTGITAIANGNGATSHTGLTVISAGTAANNYGITIGADGGSNNYALYISSPSIADTTNFSIYSSSPAQSYFAGNIGIGTTAPGATLDVRGTAIINSSVNNGSFQIVNASGTNFFVNGSNGNVGIGTATPDGLLSVLGTQPTNANGVSPGIYLATGGGATVGGGNGGPINITSGVGGPGSTHDGSGGNITISAGAGGNAGGLDRGKGGSVIINPGAAGSAAAGNIILANLQGNVGIGTASPITQFHVPGITPVNIANATNLPYTRAIAIQGRYLYMVSDNGTANANNTFSIYDVSDPTAPKALGNLTFVGGRPLDVKVQGQYAYVPIYGNPVEIIDITNPAKPFVAGNVTLPGLPIRLQVEGRYMYVVEQSPYLLFIYDISNVTSPSYVSNASLNGTNIVELQVRGPFVFTSTAGTNTTFQVWNVQNPRSIISVSNTSQGFLTNELTVQGRYAYISTNTGIAAVDLSNLSFPIITNLTALGNGSGHILAEGRYLYYSVGSNNRLMVADVSNISNPTVVANVSCSGCALGMVIQGRYLFANNVAAASTGGFYVFDLGGAYIQSLEAGSAEVGALAVRQGINAVDGMFEGSVTVGGSLLTQGDAAFRSAKVGNGTARNATGTGDFYVTNNIEYGGNLYGPGADVAEMINSTGALEAGDVVVADDTKTESIKLSTKQYDTAVVGIVSTDPSYIMSKQHGNTMLALTGRVPIKVSTENGAIKPGDLLTTSSTPGYAMKCASRQECQGAIVAKSLGMLNNGTGTITAMVMLG